MVDSSDNVWVFWQAFPGEGGIWYRRFLRATMAWETAERTQVPGTDAGELAQASLTAVSDAEGGIWLFWLSTAHIVGLSTANIWYARYNPVTQIWGEPRQMTGFLRNDADTLRLARTRRLALALLAPLRRNSWALPTVLSEDFPLDLAERGYRADERRDTACHGVSLTFADGIQPGGSDLEVLSCPEPNDFSIFAGAAPVRGRPVRVRNNLRYSTQPWTNPQRAARDGVAVIPPLTTPTGPAGAPPCVDIVYLDVWDHDLVGRDCSGLLHAAYPSCMLA